MTKRSPTVASMRTAVRALLALALALVLGAGVLLSIAAATTAPAGAAGSGTVTYSAQLDIPAPPSSSFSGSAGGDGWGLAFTSTAVYNVFHHDSILQVACHKQTDASACWAPKTIIGGSGHGFSSAAQPGLWMNQDTGHLYVFATRSDNTGGVVCIDTTQPASNPDPFCGFTALTPVGDSPINGSISMISDPVVVGTNWYAFNGVDVTGTGAKNKLLCFSLVTYAACPSQPYAVTLGAGASITETDFPSPSIAAIGTQIIVPVGYSGGDELACFDTNTHGNCTGTWPVDTTASGYPEGSDGGAAFPTLSGTGAATGFCLPIASLPCYALTGATATTPAGMSTAIPDTTSGWNGPSLTIGARVYIPDGNAETVDCYDYVAAASCTNFPKAISNLGLLYTVNPDPLRPSCIWVNSDDGTAQIQNFDAYTGAGCGQGPVRVLAASVVAPNNICIPANYTSIQVLTPSPGQYSSGTVQFEDFNGNPIASIPTQTLDGTGSVDLSSLNLTTKSPLPQFLITLNGAGSPPEVDVKLTWTGTPSPLCTPGGQHPTQGYRLSGRDGGVFAFGTDAFYGSLTGKHLNGPIVGMAATPDNQGYWLDGADGGVFAFGDATYYGGLGAQVHLNAPIVGMAATPTGKGYWLVAADGGVFSFGDATFYGSKGAGGATAKVVGMAVTPSGHGYWLVSADGNVYPFGDAVAHGSMYQKFLAAPITGIAATSSGNGYWFSGADGGVFAFGDAGFFGSEVGQHLVGAVDGIQPVKSGTGYWLGSTDGGVFAFGTALFQGGEATSPLNAPLDGITS